MSSSLILGNNNKPFFDQILTFNEKWISYDNQVSGWTKKQLQSTSQTQTCKKKKKSWSLFGSLLKVWPTMAFWIPAKPLHLRSMLSKSMRCTENCNACSWHWSTEWDQFSSTTSPDHTSHNQSFRIWIGLWSFASNSIFTWPLANWLPLLQVSQQLSPGKMLPQPAGGRKCFPRVGWILKHGFLHYRNKQTYFSWAKLSWL